MSCRVEIMSEELAAKLHQEDSEPNDVVWYKADNPAYSNLSKLQKEYSGLSFIDIFEHLIGVLVHECRNFWKQGKEKEEEVSLTSP